MSPTAPLIVVAPVAGKIVALTDVPDPVFAEAMVGPGIAIEPGSTLTVARAPIAGRLVKLHPHAFLIEASPTADAATHPAILVHLGVDTVELAANAFQLIAQEGGYIAAGERIVSWNPAVVRASGRSAVVVVIAMDATSGQLTELAEPGLRVQAGAPLFSLTP